MRVILLPSFLLLPVGKQSQLLLQPTEVELGLQVGVEFDNICMQLEVIISGHVEKTSDKILKIAPTIAILVCTPKFWGGNGK